MRFREHHGRCRGCTEAIEWWLTPKGERMPMDPMPRRESKAVSHWSTCKQAELFREKRADGANGAGGQAGLFGE